MEKTVIIGGQEVRMRGSALIPKLYRFRFGRDMVQDMRKLEKSYKKAMEASKDETDEEAKVDAQLSALDLTIFENVAWLMARHADPDNVPDDPDEWLDSIDGIFSVYAVMPVIMELWRMNNAQTSVPRKK